MNKSTELTSNMETCMSTKLSVSRRWVNHCISAFCKNMLNDFRCIKPVGPKNVIYCFTKHFLSCTDHTILLSASKLSKTLDSNATQLVWIRISIFEMCLRKEALIRVYGFSTKQYGPFFTLWKPGVIAGHSMSLVDIPCHKSIARLEYPDLYLDTATLLWYSKI